MLCVPSFGAFRFCIHAIVASVLAASASIDIPVRQDARHAVKDFAALVLLQASAHLSHPPDHDSPRMLAAEGCDGSTAMLQHAGFILILHGVDTGDHKQQKELLDKPRNPFINEDNQDILVAMEKLKTDRKNHNQTLLFKSILHRDTEATLSKRLRDMGTLAAYSTRRNKLDQLICMVRDCFLDTDEDKTTYGYPVDSNGKPSRLCFERRDSKAKDYKAKLMVKNLAKNLKFFDWQEENGIKILKNAGYHPAKVYYEDMIAFQSDKGKVQTSLNAWTEVLKAWGVTPDTSKLTKYLTGQAGIWEAPTQKSTIYNLKEVEAELKKLGRTNLLRD